MTCGCRSQIEPTVQNNDYPLFRERRARIGGDDYDENNIIFNITTKINAF